MGEELLWGSKPEWAALFVLDGDVCVTCSLRFTSGMTLVDLFIASMAAELFSSTYLQAGIGRAQKQGSIVLSLPHSVRPGRWSTD